MRRMSWPVSGRGCNGYDPLMDPSVPAWALVIVTGLLVIASALQYVQSRSSTRAQEKATKVLEEQAAALAATAKANQAVADEMLEARRRAIPLELLVVDADPTNGMLNVQIKRNGDRGIWILKAEVLVGVPGDEKVVFTNPYGNCYLGAGRNSVYVRAQIGGVQGDSVRLLVTGRPEGGLEQVHETLFWINADKPPTKLSTEGDWGRLEGPISTIA